MKDPIINDILVKALSGEELNPQEQVLFDEWLAADEGNRAMYANWKDETYFRQKLMEVHQIDVAEAKRKIDEKIAANGSVIPLWRNWIQYAAAAMLFIAVSTYFWINRSTPATPPQTDTNTIVHQNDIAPGQNKAVLTLSDGRKIALDSNSVNSLDEQGNLIKNKNGQLVYEPGSKHANEVLYNTLTTARGETYSIILSDGSTVTLNSASSIRYPIVFPNGERKIEITGEAFFDVTHDATHPFVVSKGGIDVTVLGTQFNVNIYEEEVPRVTLIKGSVKVTLEKQQPVIIKPGQQAFVFDNDQLKVTDQVNLEAVMAWKNGRFYFDNASITSVMTQLQRWYNIEVVYEGAKPTQVFGGELQRNLNLSQVIRALEHTGVRFKMEGRKVIVMQ
jgi:ferric-dicitrate binding protein FerR (iron transport regulator)